MIPSGVRFTHAHDRSDFSECWAGFGTRHPPVGERREAPVGSPILFSPAAGVLWLLMTVVGACLLRSAKRAQDSEGDQVINVVDLDNDVEASLLDTLLEERHVPHLMVSRLDPAYGSLFQMSAGWGFVRSPKRYAGEVLRALEESRGSTSA